MSEKKTIEIKKIEEVEYSSTSKNMTSLKVNKEWLLSALESNHIEVVLKHLTKKIFNYENYYEKQRVIALQNLVRSMIKVLPKKDEYNLSALLNKLKASQNSEKVKPLKCKKQRLELILALIFCYI